jgi:hypothetical protein
MRMMKNNVTPMDSKEIYLVASGDLRLSANQICWPAQKEMEEKLMNAFSLEGYQVVRALPYDEKLKHGFIWTQRIGLKISPIKPGSSSPSQCGNTATMSLPACATTASRF